VIRAVHTLYSPKVHFHTIANPLVHFETSNDWNSGSLCALSGDCILSPVSDFGD
jgi:hypothetical protein